MSQGQLFDITPYIKRKDNRTAQVDRTDPAWETPRLGEELWRYLPKPKMVGRLLTRQEMEKENWDKKNYIRVDTLPDEEQLVLSQQRVTNLRLVISQYEQYLNKLRTGSRRYQEFEQSINRLRCDIEEELADTAHLRQIKSSHVERKIVERANFYHWVEEYPVKQRYYYFRYCHLSPNDITQVNKLHIPKGSVRTSVGQARAELIRHAIASGSSPGEIEALIKSWLQDERRSSFEAEL